MARSTNTGQIAPVPPPTTAPHSPTGTVYLERVLKDLEAFRKAGFSAIARSHERRRKKAKETINFPYRESD